MIDNVQERIPRLLALVPWLSSRPGVTFSETAQHFGISIEQLTLDLYQLVVCGLPGYGPDQLVDIDFYDLEHIWVTDPQTLTTPLRLTSEELTALSIALRLLAQIPGVEYKDELVSLTAKLDNAASGHMTVKFADLVQIEAQVDQVVNEVVERGLGEGLMIKFEYHSDADSITHRLVSPLRVFGIDDHVYLEAYCEHAEAIRIFRLDRMREPAVTTEPARLIEVPPAAPNLEAVSNAPTAEILLSEKTSWVAEETWVTTDPMDPLRIFVPYLSEDWLVRWVLSLGGGIRLISPPHLAAIIRETASAGKVKLLQSRTSG